MRHLRSIGALMVVSAIICFVIAWEKYQSAMATGRAIAEQIEEIEFVSVGFPKETLVAGFFGMVLLVAGVRCFLTWRQMANQPESGLIQSTESE